MALTLQLSQIGLIFVLFELLCAGFGRVIQNDHKYLCFPDGNADKYAICFDMESSNYVYIPLTSQSDINSFGVTDDMEKYPRDHGHEFINADVFRSIEPTEKYTGFEKVFQRVLKRLAETDKMKSKKLLNVSKRPFDSIAYGSYFGGFGKKR